MKNKTLTLLVVLVCGGLISTMRPTSVQAAGSCFDQNRYIVVTSKDSGNNKTFTFNPGQRIKESVNETGQASGFDFNSIERDQYSIRANISCDGSDIKNKTWFWDATNQSPQSLSVSLSELNNRSCILEAAVDIVSGSTGITEAFSCASGLSTVYLDQPSILPDSDGGFTIRLTKPVSKDVVMSDYKLRCRTKVNGTTYLISKDFNPSDYDEATGTITFDLGGVECLDPKVLVNGKPLAVAPNLKNIEIIPNYPCKFISDTEEKRECNACMISGGKPSGKVWTVFGCLDTTSTGSFFDTAFKIFIYILGGIIMMLTIYATTLVTLSQGDAEKLKTAKSIFTAIAAGTAFIIFSIMIMKFIGLTLLDLPTLRSS